MLFDPKANVEGGTKYLRELMEQYNFDIDQSLAAYNAGPQRVEQFRRSSSLLRDAGIRRAHRKGLQQEEDWRSRKPGPSRRKRLAQNSVREGRTPFPRKSSIRQEQYCRRRTDWNRQILPGTFFCNRGHENRLTAALTSV